MMSHDVVPALCLLFCLCFVGISHGYDATKFTRKDFQEVVRARRAIRRCNDIPNHAYRDLSYKGFNYRKITKLRIKKFNLARRGRTNLGSTHMPLVLGVNTTAAEQTELFWLSRPAEFCLKPKGRKPVCIKPVEMLGRVGTGSLYVWKHGDNEQLKKLVDLAFKCYSDNIKHVMMFDVVCSKAAGFELDKEEPVSHGQNQGTNLLVEEDESLTKKKKKNKTKKEEIGPKYYAAWRVMIGTTSDNKQTWMTIMYGAH